MSAPVRPSRRAAAPSPKTRFGMEFITREWVQNHTAMWQIHANGDDYDAAKALVEQDFSPCPVYPKLS